jgi:hypothetical protein
MLHSWRMKKILKKTMKRLYTILLNTKNGTGLKLPVPYLKG